MKARFFVIVLLLFVSCNTQKSTISFGLVKANWYGPMSEALSDFVAMNYRLPKSTEEMISFINWRLSFFDRESIYFGCGEVLTQELNRYRNSLSINEDSCHFVSPSLRCRKERVTGYSPRVLFSKSLENDLYCDNIYSQFIPRFFNEKDSLLLSYYNEEQFILGINRINASFNSGVVQVLGNSIKLYKTVFEKTRGVPITITELVVDSTKTRLLYRDGSIDIINNNPVVANLRQRRLLTEFIDSLMVDHPQINKVCFISGIYY